MTCSAAFRCVQAWLLEKPAAWADKDTPCLAAALMVQRPPYERPRKDVLLEANQPPKHRSGQLGGLKQRLGRRGLGRPCGATAAEVGG